MSYIFEDFPVLHEDFIIEVLLLDRFTPQRTMFPRTFSHAHALLDGILTTKEQLDETQVQILEEFVALEARRGDRGGAALWALWTLAQANRDSLNTLGIDVRYTRRALDVLADTYITTDTTEGAVA